MSAPTIEQILALVLSKSNGDPDDQAVLSSIVEHSIRRTNDGVSVVDAYGSVRKSAAGESMTFAELLGEIQSQRPELFKDAPAQKPDIKQTMQAASSGHQSMTFTDKMMAEVAARSSTDGRKQQAAEIATKGNPWGKATRNLTNQMRIENLDKDLAAKLKAQAGVAA
ncbi:hypothetical protein [Microvirga sp. 2TAF3]|uniref:hypothetical protein n=1 Tax=Microvirga sp. 2TAF3 TaxID=3233014 RepID=UPI003F98A8F6